MGKKISNNLTVSATRSLVIDMINKANSGHPGMGLDAAPIMVALFRDHLVADPKDPTWWNRDRLVFSSGHASSLLYATLHLAGYPLSMDDLKSFRQLGSKTPGHPEYGVTAGIDATSGPLGQGIAQAVGMALAEQTIAASYPEGDKIMSHYTYCLCGDGCLEEGISQEAISLAGLHGLNKLILFYDCNGATLDGPTSDSLCENVKLRFLASNWHVYEVKDGNDVDAISAAVAKAKKNRALPSVIIVNSIIGYGSSKQGSHKTHGSPLGKEDGDHAKAVYGYDYPEFTVPESVYEEYQRTFAERGKKAHEEHSARVNDYKTFHKEEFAAFEAALKGEFKIPENVPAPEKPEATRVSSGRILSAFADSIPAMFGGSADVASSTNTTGKNMVMHTVEHREGHDMHYGVREFAMAALNNGIALHGGLRPYCSCFLVFADYMKPAIRMAALQKLPAIYLFTHDSLAVGEDGPTHEPIEQLAMLRSIPGLEVFRPADYKETYAAYVHALKAKDHPTAIILSRQALPTLEASDPEKALKGGYVVREPKKAAVSIIATGSEVSLALEAAELLKQRKIEARVISAPNPMLLRKQDEAYKASVLGEREKTVSLEMASTYGWGDLAACCIGVDEFGDSGKAGEVLAKHGFTKEAVASKIASFLGKK